MAESRGKKRSTLDDALLAANLGEYINMNDEKPIDKPPKEATSMCYHFFSADFNE